MGFLFYKSGKKTSAHDERVFNATILIIFYFAAGDRLKLKDPVGTGTPKNNSCSPKGFLKKQYILAGIHSSKNDFFK